MIVYFATSALVPLIIDEPSSTTVSRPWDEAERVLSSRLVYAEGRAALAMARRTGRLDARGFREAVRAFGEVHDQLDSIEVTEGLVREAGRLAEPVGPRAHDAVHLASARLIAAADTVLATGDAELLATASVIGLATADLAS